MFGSQDPVLANAITKSFNLIMIVVSVLGYLVSNHDFSF